MTDLKHGEHRHHAALGPCKILALEGRFGMLVALRMDSHGRPVSVHAVDALDERGWGRPRRVRGSITDKEKRHAVKLRGAGMSHSEIANELGVSRSVAGRIVKGIPRGEYERRERVPVSEEDVKEILSMLKRGWRRTVIANWFGCSAQMVSDIASGKRHRRSA